MIKGDMIFQCQLGDYSLYVYKPTVSRLFWSNMEPLTIRKKIRFTLEYFSGYRVYYLMKDFQSIGYCVVSSGGSFRYKSFSSSRDVIVGPYYISPEWRGKHLSELLLESVLVMTGNSFVYAYDYIDKTNSISQSASKHVGFSYISDIRVTALLRILKTTDSGGYLLYRYNGNSVKRENNG